MTQRDRSSLLSRRALLRAAGVALALAAGGGLLPRGLSRLLLPEHVGVAAAADPPHDLFFAGTDGCVCQSELRLQASLQLEQGVKPLGGEEQPKVDVVVL